MVLSDNVDCMKFDILLPLLNWIGILLGRNLKYLANMNYIVKLMTKTPLPNETASELADAIQEILEKIFTTNYMGSTRDSIFKYYVNILFIFRLYLF